MRALATDDELVVIYRAATKEVNRDLFALLSRDHGATFRGARVDEWRSAQCVMSTVAASVARTDAGGIIAAWENQGDVLYDLTAREETRGALLTTPVRPPKSVGGARAPRKHPSVAMNARGEVLLAWTEGMGWEKGGTLVWQLFASDGKPLAGPSNGVESGRAEGVPTWSLVAAAALADGSFLIVY